MRNSCIDVVLVAGLAALPSATFADTLFLATGKTLKIDALSCDGKACIATLAGGDIEVRPRDVLRVDPDEEVDLEPAPASPVARAPSGNAGDRTIEEIVADAAHNYGLPRSLVRD